MKTFYFIAIGGTGMASVAGLLKQVGHKVLGSDGKIYPPMSTMLEKYEIPVNYGYSEDNITKQHIDYIVVGNVLSKGMNSELDYAIKHKYKLISFPEVIEKFFLPDKKSIVITGTHGKTTVTAYICSVLEKAGTPITFFIGGQSNSFPYSFQFKKEAEYVILEGDEYDTAYFDKEPKFFHYHPDILIINNLEFDHADIYNSLGEIKDKFLKLVKSMPSSGIIIANGCDSNVMDVCEAAPCKVICFGFDDQDRKIDLDYVAISKEFKEDKTSYILKTSRYEKEVTIPLLGQFNVLNSLAVIVLLDILGITKKNDLNKYMSRYAGVKRRLEVLGKKNGITIYDDFAHHPTAVENTIQALRKSIKLGRIWALFEPKSATSRRNKFMNNYSRAFKEADFVIIGKVFEDNEEIINLVLNEVKPNDHILIMSSGNFGNIHQKLLSVLIK